VSIYRDKMAALLNERIVIYVSVSLIDVKDGNYLILYLPLG